LGLNLEDIDKTRLGGETMFFGVRSHEGRGTMSLAALKRKLQEALASADKKATKAAKAAVRKKRAENAKASMFPGQHRGY
jgi:hypothetical protein